MPLFGNAFAAGAFEGPGGNLLAGLQSGPGSFNTGANPFGVPILQNLDQLLHNLNLMPDQIAAMIVPHVDEVLTAGGTDFGTTVAGDTHATQTAIADGDAGLAAIKDAIDGKFVPTSANNADAVWLHNLEASEYFASPHAGAALYDVMFRAKMGQLSGYRSFKEPWFVWFVWGYGHNDTPDAFSFFLGAGDPADKPEDESDLDYMRGVLGTWDWGSDYQCHKPQAVLTFNEYQMQVFYDPLPAEDTITEPAFVEGMLAVKPTEWAGLKDGGLSLSDALSVSWKVALSGAVEAVRYTGAAHFLVVQHTVEDGAGVMPPTGRQALLHPMNISPGAQLPTESDVEFLNRIEAGGLTWEWKAGANSIAYATDTDVGAGVVEEYYYSPLDRFPNSQRMLTYTPNSGPPDRSLWEDAVALMSRLPISFE